MLLLYILPFEVHEENSVDGCKLIFPVFSLLRLRIQVCGKIVLNNIFYGDPMFGNITSLKFTNTERPNEYIEGKGIRYDIKCETAAGHQFIVEMQKGEQKHFLERCGYYISRATAEQGYKGKNDKKQVWDFSLVPVVGVFFCNFPVEGLPEKPFTTARLRDDDTGEPLGNFQRYAFVQIPCFYKEKDECKSLLEQWIYNIKNMGMDQSIAFTEHNAIFKYLESVSNYAALSPAERDDYEAALMRVRDDHAILMTAKEKAMAEGRAEGRAEGMAEGEKKERKESIRIMLSFGIPVEQIAEKYNISVNEVKEIADSI